VHGTGSGGRCVCEREIPALVAEEGQVADGQCTQRVADVA